jgi:hypothetical protein
MQDVPNFLLVQRYLVSEEEGFSADVRERVGLASFQLGINFLLHTYIRTKKKLRCVERCLQGTRHMLSEVLQS